MSITFEDLLHDGRPHVFDGAMGTVLYGRGVDINRCFDELNLRDPKLVRGLHEEYVNAGAEILETNSYGANRVKLSGYGLEEKVREINARAAELARAAAEDRALVAGAMGPLGIRIEPYGPTSLEEARDLFREQAEALLEGGAQLFLLETFSDLREIEQAIAAVRFLGDHPVIAQIAVQPDGRTSLGTDAAVFVARAEEWGASVAGLNCSVGPQPMLEMVEGMAAATTLPISAQPNAGLPKDVAGRKIYMASPQYMAKYAAHLIRKGARFVGACCGSTPEHVARIADAVQMLAPRTRPVVVGTAQRNEADEGVEPVPLARRSRWGAKLAAGELVTSVEIVPPRGVNPDAMLDGVRLLKEAGVDAVNVPDGPRAQSRMGVLATSLLIQQRVGIEAVVHYCCRDRNLLGMLSDLLGAYATGIRNLLVITGDPPKMGPYPDATAVFDVDAIGLTNLISGLNRGLDPGGNALDEPTGFVTGVGVNPGASDLEHEMRRFYWKVDAGAEYAITQPVFDLRQLEGFLERLDRENLRIPIVAGIWPLVSIRNAEFLANEVPGVVIPDRVRARMRRANACGKEHAVEEGIAIAQEMLSDCRDAINGVQVSAPFGRVPLALRVLESLAGGIVAPLAAHGR
jgi:methionine synthase / methylenetetrahydrofolate reductase(NADPH)